MQKLHKFEIISSIVYKISSYLELFFRVSELKNDRNLIFVSVALFLSYIISFYELIEKDLTKFTCSPYVSNCEFFQRLLIFPSTATDYTQNYFFISLLGIIFLGIYSLVKKDYLSVWYTLFILFTVKFLYVFAFGSGNFDHYDLILSAVFLFAHNKFFFLRIVFVYLYFLAATVKFHDSWILGTYFSTLSTGLPLFPESTIPIWTNLIILTQIFLCWGLLYSKKTKLYLIAELFFILFHIYSGFLVEYRYVLTTLPMMLVLFIIPEKKYFYNYSKNIFVIFLMILLLIGQMIGYSIKGDQKLTLEGHSFGLHMFDANHQCTSEVIWKKYSGEKTAWKYSSSFSHDRCNPFDVYIKFKPLCGKSIESATFIFNHSVNGSPFYKIVDEKNLCDLNYVSYLKNSWIKSELDFPEIVGLPVQNILDGYRNIEDINATMKGDYLILPGLEKNKPIELSTLQLYIKPYIYSLISIYWILWGIMFVFLIYNFIGKIKLLNKYKNIN